MSFSLNVNVQIVIHVCVFETFLEALSSYTEQSTL